MTQDLNTFSNTELKNYIKVNRNNETAFHEALAVLMSRGNSPKYPAPWQMPSEEVEALFRAKIKPMGEGEKE